MTDTEIAILLLAAVVVLLFLCWVSLRAVGDKIDSLFHTMRGFMTYYEQLNDSQVRKRLEIDSMADQSFAQWPAEDPKDSNLASRPGAVV